MVLVIYPLSPLNSGTKPQVLSGVFQLICLNIAGANGRVGTQLAPSLPLQSGRAVREIAAWLLRSVSLKTLRCGQVTFLHGVTGSAKLHGGSLFAEL